MFSPGSPGSPGVAAPCQPSSSSVEHRGYSEFDPDPGLLFPAARSSLLAQRLRHLRACGSPSRPVTRRKREMIPTDMKDANYWDKRHKNNEAAKRSRQKRRLKDLMMEDRILALGEENAQLRAQLIGMQCHISLRAETSNAAEAPAASALALSHSAAPLFRAGMWGSSPVSVLGVRPRVSRFSSAIGAVGGLTAHSRVSHTESGSSEETEMGHQHVSSSDEIHNSTDAPSRHLGPDFLHRAFAFSPASQPAQSWLMSHLNPSSNLLLPWRSSYLAPAPAYPSPPLAGLQADLHRGFRRFSSAPAELGTHLRTDGR